MKVLIDIPDDQAAALRTKAAERGLTLEAWLLELAEECVRDGRRQRYRLADLLAGCDPALG